MFRWRRIRIRLWGTNPTSVVKEGVLYLELKQRQVWACPKKISLTQGERFTPHVKRREEDRVE